MIHTRFPQAGRHGRLDFGSTLEIPWGGRIILCRQVTEFPDPEKSRQKQPHSSGLVYGFKASDPHLEEASGVLVVNASPLSLGERRAVEEEGILRFHLEGPLRFMTDLSVIGTQERSRA